MTENDIFLLKDLSRIAKELKNKPLSKDYLKKDEEIFEKLRKKSEEMSKAIAMSPEKFRTQFTI